MKTDSPPVSDVSTIEFQEKVIASPVPVVVDFWAPWCGPCRQLAPLLENVARDYQGELRVVKVNVDDESALASSFGIRSIPSLIFYKNGSPKEMISGMRSAVDLRTWIDGHLATV